MKLYNVVETLPDGRRRVLAAGLKLDAALTVYHSEVTWAGTIEQA